MTGGGSDDEPRGVGDDASIGAARDVQSPASIDDYELLDRFAAGGMAELFRARRKSDGALVCLKRIRQAHCQDERFVIEFVRELALATTLRHPNVVRVHAWGQGESSFYVMELVDGTDLATLVGHLGSLPPDVVAHIGASLARALVYIHHRDGERSPLIHCDVTPHNVLIDSSGAVKLSDFGVAKALGTTGAATLTRPRGKAGYLAPEQLDGEAYIDARVDLFTLGLVLWGALIGTHPYVERCPAGRQLETWIPSQLRKNARRRVVDAAPAAPAGLCDTIEQLLQPAEARTPAAERVLAALEPHVQPESAARLGRLVSSIPRETP